MALPVKYLRWALKGAGRTFQTVDLHQQRENACGIFKLSDDAEAVQVILDKHQGAVEDRVGNLVEARWLKVILKF